MDNVKSISEYKTKLKEAENLQRTDPHKSIVELLKLYDELFADYSKTSLFLDILIAIGSNYEDLNNLDKAEEYYFLAEKLAKKNHSREKEAKIYNGLGIVYRKQDKYNEALNYYLKSLYLREELNLQRETIISCNNIGILYNTMKDYRNAKLNLEKAYKLSRKADDKLLVCATLNNLGLLFHAQSKYDFALKVHYEAMEIAFEMKDKKVLADTYNNLGIDYGHLGEIKNAEENYNKAINIYEELREERGICRITYNYGITALKTDNLDLALKLFQKVEKLALKNNYISLLDKVYIGLSDTYAKLSYFKDAYYNLEKSQDIREKIYESGLAKNAAEHRKNYELKLKEQEKEIYRLKNVELTRLNNELKEINTSKDKLFSIIAHDLRNPLNTLIGVTDLLLKHQNDVTAEKIEKYLILLRSSSYTLNALLENLLDWSRSQMGAIKLRPDFFDIKNLISENILLLKPLAQKKHIEIHSNIKNDTFAFFDKDVITIVLRNLLFFANCFSPLLQA